MRLRFGIVTGVLLLSLISYQSADAQRYEPSKVPPQVRSLIRLNRELTDEEKSVIRTALAAPQVRRMISARSGSEIQDTKQTLLNPLRDLSVSLYFYNVCFAS